jgi:hypothetical protein
VETDLSSPHVARYSLISLIQVGARDIVMKGWDFMNRRTWHLIRMMKLQRNFPSGAISGWHKVQRPFAFSSTCEISLGPIIY